MLDSVARLPDDCRASYREALGLTGLPSMSDVASIVFCGMGGSAVAGDVLRSVFRDRLPIPVEVNRSPVLPHHAGRQTLVAICSYSGNTAETLASFREAIARGCRVAVVTSGGAAKTLATEHGIPVIPVPGGYQPRAAFGHLGFAWLGALEAMGVLPALAAEVDETASLLDELVAGSLPEVPTPANRAKRLAETIGDRVPVVWGAEGVASVAAMRWKTQMNENGKVPAFAASMSELDHNEVVGWTRPYGERFAVVSLRTDDEHPEIAPRFALSEAIAEAAGALTTQVDAQGRSPLARLLTLIYLGDMASVYVGL
ncbi:MAG: glucose/mannose-6-phosphate isomerase, partial [Actinomycetota bacterium]|nr:glucose/mannose-6-phosphate isomerase [Actinomycetota bacterium]